MHVYMYVPMYGFVWVYVCLYMHDAEFKASRLEDWNGVYGFIYMYVYMYVCLCMYVCMCIHDAGLKASRLDD